ncbi:MAG: lipopolysaccharide biosynthesis protein [Acidimicrobiales bacterium]
MDARHQTVVVADDGDTGPEHRDIGPSGALDGRAPDAASDVRTEDPAVPVSGSRRGEQVAIFGFALIAGQALSAATTPFFTRALGPADFGALDVLTVAGTFLATLLLVGLDQAVVRSFYDDRSLAAQRRLVSSGFICATLTGVVGCALVLPFRNQVADLLLGSSGFEPVLLATLIGVPPFIGAAYMAEVLRLQGCPRPYAISSVLRAVAGCAVAAWLVLVVHAGAEGALLGLAAGSLVALGYDVVMARRLLRPVVARRPLGHMLRFGLPLVPTGVALWSLMVADRLILVHYVSLRQIGIYALAAKIAVLLLWAVNGFRAGWTASVIELHGRDREEATRRRSAALVDALAVAVGMAAVIGALAAELTAVGGGPYFGSAVRIIPILLAALVLFSTTSVTQSAMLIRCRTGVMARHTAIAAVLNLLACLLLVPIWGIVGAGLATLVGFAYLSGSFYVSAQRMDRMPYRPLQAAVVAAIVLPFLALGQFMIGPLVFSIAVKLACLSILPALLRRAGVACPRVSEFVALIRHRVSSGS